MTTKEQTPTPTPWFIGSREGYNACTIYARTGKDSIHDKSVASVYGICLNQKVEDCQSDEGMPNAKFIVEAVNNYESLRSQNETLRRALEEMRNLRIKEIA